MAPSRQWPSEVFLAVTLTAAIVMTLPPVTLAKPANCLAFVEPAFPSCQCRGALDSQGTETLDVVLDCSGRGLTSMPQAAGSGLPSNILLHSFLLGDNNITRLESSSFTGVRTRAVDLSGNRLASVADDAFLPLQDDLRELQMDGDGSVSPSATALGRLQNLEVLTLRNYNVEFLGDTDHMYFLALKALQHLTLHGWTLKGIEPEAFRGIDALSSLTLTNHADMRGLPVDPLAEGHLDTLTFLKISSTPIQEITLRAFERLTNLQELDLSGNTIINLDPDCFYGLGSSLKKLSIASNNLHTDASDLAGLANLPQLEELDLSNNENINAIPRLSLLNTADGTSISVHLNNNKISTLPANTFTGISDKLRALDLSSNRINSMDQASFNGVTGLQELRLSTQSGLTGQQLVIPDSLKQSSGSLTHLFLNGQTLHQATLWPVLRPMAKLEVLDLGNAGLSQVPGLTFQAMTLLRELYLTGNSLTSLNQESLVGPRTSLKKLYLDQNPLQRISSCVFEDYTSFPITMSLQSAPLICDCTLGWLLTASNQDRKVQFTLGHEPTCRNMNNEPLLSKTLAQICTDNAYTDGSCGSFYTTPRSDVTTDPDAPALTLTLDKITSDSITVTWSLSDTTDLRSFSVRVSNTFADSQYVRDNLSPLIFQVEAKPLLPDERHTVCVIANFQTINSVTSCKDKRTLVGNGGNSGSQEDDSENIGIIIGAVVGVIILLLILAAIFYLVVVRRRPKKDAGTINNGVPIQPRNFTKSELPGITEDSRTFTRPKQRPGSSSHSHDHFDGMQVVAISDGQMSRDRRTSNGSAGGSRRVGRAAMLNSDGSYKTMMADSGIPSASERGSRPSSQSTYYENDRGPLPSPPHHRQGNSGPRQPGYYNHGFEEDKYDEIGTGGMREVTV